jgi:hypothetical protein
MDLSKSTTLRDSICVDTAQSDLIYRITVFAFQVESVSLVVQPKVGQVINIDFFSTTLTSIQEECHLSDGQV